MERKKHKQNKCKSNIYTSRVENDENIHAEIKPTTAYLL